MKKKNFIKLFAIVVLSISLSTTSYAQDTRTFEFNHDRNGVQLLEQTRGNVKIQFSLDKMSLSSFDYRGEQMHSIGISDITIPNEKGLPNVPSISRLIAVPEGAEAVLHITGYEQQIIKDVNIEPSLGVQAEDAEPNTEFTKDAKTYSENAFYPEQFATVSGITQLRGVNAAAIVFNPVRFNPVTKEVIVYHNIEVEIEFVGGNGEFCDNRLRSPYFDPILKQNLMNYNTLPDVDYEARMQEWIRDNADGAEYVIVIPNNESFEEPAQRLRDYRMKQGIITEVVRLDQMPATTTDEMKSWFHNAYNNWDIAPVAVLLFGDHNTNMSQGIPAETTSHPSSNVCITDNQYADASGNDLLPDMVFSRLVAANGTEAAMMADKQIEYEFTNPNLDPEAYNKPVTALGWQTERWFQICSEVIGGYFRSNGKQPLRVNCIYNGTPGTTWSTAQNTNTVVSYFGPQGMGYIPQSPSELGGFTGGTPEQIVQAINSGTMIVQHRDHGFEDGWGEPAFRSEHVNQLTNTGKMPFVFSINCLTGKFNNATPCFGEVFLRHTYNGQNAGAVGLLCPTEISYSFVNDSYVWGVYDQFQPDFMPDYGPFVERNGNWLPAFGNVAGKLFLYQSSWPYNFTEKDITYQMFTAHCDAFLRLYSETPQQMTVQHPSVQLAGLENIEITAPEGTTIALTKGEGEFLEILATATATGSTQTIQIPAQTPPTIINLTVTGQNYLRYTGEIEVIPSEGPYIIVNSFNLLNDASQLNFGDDTGFNIELKNVGSENSTNGTAVLWTDSEYVTITNDTFTFPGINSNTTSSHDNAFSFTISDQVPNKTSINFVITITAGGEEYESTINLKAYAPVFKIRQYVIEEISGNGNNRLETGETAKIIIPIENKGNAASNEVLASLTMENPFLEITSQSVASFDKIESDQTVNAEFEIYVHESPSSFNAAFSLNVESGYYTASDNFIAKLNLLVEDFESGLLNPTIWTNDTNSPWTIDTNDPYEGQKCMKSGPIGDNQETVLSLSYDVQDNDSISFYYKVSSETNYDKLLFYIDNNQKGAWSGNIGWTKAEYAVTAGNHVFKWIYRKDNSMSSGSDCAWIDFVTMPKIYDLFVSAGVDIQSCENDDVQIFGYVVSCTTMEWTTSGDGTFNNTSIENPIYTPGTQDIQNGSVTVTLSVSDGTTTISDSAVITFISDAHIEVLEGQPACLGTVDVSTYLNITGTNSYTLSSYGDGIFDGSIYTFGEQDLAAGQVTINVTAYGCSSVSEEIVITNIGEPIITGPETITSCGTKPIEINLSTENVFGLVAWTTTGNGVFSEETTEHAIYTPSIEDVQSGAVTLTVELNSCSETTVQYNVTLSLTAVATLPTPQGQTEVYNFNAVTEYFVEPNEMFNAYTWTLEPADAGIMTPDNNKVTIAWNMNTQDGTVYLSVVGHTDDCGDSNPSQPLEIALTGYGIEENTAATMSIHPNPTNGMLNIAIDGVCSDVQICVFNIVGEKVLVNNISVDDRLNTSIDLSDLANGTYILQVRSNGNMWIKMIIKE
ncbi:MAG: C25 family cysteine peptidase [Candidatus Limimorpha sp.]